jgi:hypothetical protein
MWVKVRRQRRGFRADHLVKIGGLVFTLRSAGSWADRTLVLCGDSPRCDGLNRPHPRPLSRVAGEGSAEPSVGAS